MLLYWFVFILRQKTIFFCVSCTESTTYSKLLSFVFYFKFPVLYVLPLSLNFEPIKNASCEDCLMEKGLIERIHIPYPQTVCNVRCILENVPSLIKIHVSN